LEVIDTAGGVAPGSDDPFCVLAAFDILGEAEDPFGVDVFGGAVVDAITGPAAG